MLGLRGLTSDPPKKKEKERDSQVQMTFSFFFFLKKKIWVDETSSIQIFL